MALTTLTSLFQYAIASLGQAFTPNCPIQNTSDFVVTYTDTSGNDTLLVLNTDYFVTGSATAGVILSPTITLEGAGLHYATGGTLTVQRKNPLTQPTNFVDGVKYLAATQNNSLDWLAYSIQELSDVSARSLRLPATSPAQAELALNARRSKVLGFDANGAVVLLPNTVQPQDVSNSFATATGSPTPRLIRDRLAAVANVKDFGAKGDGVTDDYAAIAAAIASLGSNGTVYFPRGVYITSQTIYVTDTFASPKSISFLGDGSKECYLYHTGGADGALKVTGSSVWGGYTIGTNNLYVPNATGGSKIRHMSIGSTGGPAVWLHSCVKVQMEDILFTSAATGAEYLLIDGCNMCNFDKLFDLGNDALPAGISFPVAVVWPNNCIRIQTGTDDDGVHGPGLTTCSELYFFGVRTDGDNTHESVVIQAGPGAYAGQQLGRIYFIGCKLSGQLRGAHVDTFATVYVDGAKSVYFADTFIEPANWLGFGIGLLVENQTFDSYVYLNHVLVSAGYIDLGTSGGTPGNYTINLTAHNCTAQRVRGNFTAAHAPAAAWVSGHSYLPNAIVSNSGTEYLCILATSGTTAPGSDATHWSARTATTSNYGVTNITGSYFVSTFLNVANLIAGLSCNLQNNKLLPFDPVTAFTVTPIADYAQGAKQFFPDASGNAIQLIGRPSTNDSIVQAFQSDGTTSEGYFNFQALGFDWHSPNGTLIFSGRNSGFMLLSVPSYADNTAALAGGLIAGNLYRNGDALQIVH